MVARAQAYAHQATRGLIDTIAQASPDQVLIDELPGKASNEVPNVADLVLILSVVSTPNSAADILRHLSTREADKPQKSVKTKVMNQQKVLKRLSRHFTLADPLEAAAALSKGWRDTIPRSLPGAKSGANQGTCVWLMTYHTRFTRTHRSLARTHVHACTDTHTLTYTHTPLTHARTFTTPRRFECVQAAPSPRCVCFGRVRARVCGI